jgi:hypothetical protein
MNEEYGELAARLAALEAASFSDKEKEVLRFLIRVVKAIEGALWLAGGMAKVGKLMIYMAPLAAIWFFWEQALHWIVSWKGQ